MKFIGDFHLHSHFSLATSNDLRPSFLDYRAKLKGIKVIGTGDFTHPGWIQELKEQLEPAEEGLLILKQAHRIKTCLLPEEDTRFILTSEISNIYKKKGSVRKVHNVVFAPSFDVAEKIQRRLITRGFNITSDGRPIIGMDSRDLLELCLECSEDIYFVPAHIWTPWFSVLGSKSGFDSVTECYEDLSEYISAVEMGLSTDPPMNWMCSFLDRYTLIANSDAHSPEKLGRNANIFNTELSYKSIIDSMRSGNPENFLGTINFFPQEGKYHFDGHRKCGIKWSPVDTLQHEEICPVCGKKITVGVMNRIAQLADRDNILDRKNRLPFYSLIPLKELLSEIEGSSPDSKKVDQLYNQLVSKAGSEFNILLHSETDVIRTLGGELLSEAIRRMRNREVYIQEGYDGEYGTIRVFKDGEIKNYNQPASLFKEPETVYHTPNTPKPLLGFDLVAFQKLRTQKPYDPEIVITSKPQEEPVEGLPENLNDEQIKAVKHFTGPAITLAGPGTGKTKVLTLRLAYLIRNRNINPDNILAVTFTNKAASEMKERLALLLDKQVMNDLKVCTFHAFGLSIIKDYLTRCGNENDFSVIDEEDKFEILTKLGTEKSIINETIQKISEIKQMQDPENVTTDNAFKETLRKYNQVLKDSGAFDLDDLLSYPVQLFSDREEILSAYRERIKWILVDEYQDINLIQYRLIRMLMPGPESNLFVIGDPDQSIYGFRGSDVKYIRIFTDDYRNAKIFRLKKSYRCSDSILRASCNILNRDQKFLEGTREGAKINISDHPTDKSEAEYIARTIERMIGGVGFFSMDSQITEGNRDIGIESLSDFTILCRISKQMPVIEKALRDHNIPYQKIGEIPFLKQEPVKKVVDVYRAIYDTGNIYLKSRLHKHRILDESDQRNLIVEMQERNLTDKLQLIIRNYFPAEAKEKELIFKLLMDIAEEFKSNEEAFFRQIMIGSGIDTWRPKIEAVNLMTMHASKGLEFNCVFISGCEEKLIPFSLFENNPSDPEEERRLLYVAMTRAKNYLFLTHARQRFLIGNEHSQRRSHFLDLIEKELLVSEPSQFRHKPGKDQDQLKLF